MHALEGSQINVNKEIAFGSFSEPILLQSDHTIQVFKLTTDKTLSSFLYRAVLPILL